MDPSEVRLILNILRQRWDLGLVVLLVPPVQQVKDRVLGDQLLLFELPEVYDRGFESIARRPGRLG